MPGPPVLYEVKDNIAQISLNRPENRNSMDDEVLPAFQQTIEQAKLDSSLRCIIITGSGKTFCAGADFKGGTKQETEGLPHENVMNIYRSFLGIVDVKVPTIAAINGHSIGGGLGLALVCDLRVINKQAKIGANFARLGLHSGMAISYILPRVVGLPIATELLVTGRLIDGEKAAEIGMANYATEPDQVLEKSWELAREVASCAPGAIRMIKRSIYRGMNWDPVTAAEIEAHCQARTFEMDDAKEGIAALLQKREPVFQGR